MSEPLHLKIPVPCHENWAEMKPDEQGRFCLSCQKTVVDFTSMTDRQVLEYFSSYTGNTCGRFTDDQLDRDIIVGVQKPTAWYKYVLSLFVPAMLLAGKSVAQMAGVCPGFSDTISPARKLVGDTIAWKKADPPSEPLRTLGRVRVGGVSASVYIPMIRGQVVDEQGTPVPHATVMIKGTSYGTVSNPDGTFTISPEHGKKVVLQVSSVGFEPKEVKVSASRKESTIVLVPLQAAWMGEVVVTGRRRKKENSLQKISRMVADSIGLKKSLVLYPNAAKPGSAVTVSYKLNKGRYNIRVINTNGQIMQADVVDLKASAATTSFRLDNAINAGQYVVVVTSDKGKIVTSGQLIVQ